MNTSNATAMRLLFLIAGCTSSASAEQSTAIMGPGNLEQKVRLGASMEEVANAFPTATPEVSTNQNSTTHFYGEWQISFCAGRVYNVARTISRTPEAFMKAAQSLSGFFGAATVRFPNISSADGDASSIALKWPAHPNYELSVIYGGQSWLVSEGNLVLCRPK